VIRRKGEKIKYTRVYDDLVERWNLDGSPHTLKRYPSYAEAKSLGITRVDHAIGKLICCYD